MEQIPPAFGTAKRGGDGVFQCAEVIGGEIRQIPVFGSAPEAFHGVEIRGVGREPFDIDALPVGQPELDIFCPMRAAAVPDKNESAGKMATQLLEEAKHLCGSDVVGIQGPIEIESLPTGRGAEGADRGESISAIPLAKNRRLPAGRPAPPDQGLKHEPALVEKDNASTGLWGVFLYGATVSHAIVECSPRRAPGLGVPASDNSILPLGGSSRREKDGIEPRRFWQ